MTYQLIDNKLNVWSCGIADLQIEHVEAFLRSWNDGSPIGALTVFYDSQTDRIVLNHDHKNYEQTKQMCCTYLELSKEKRADMYESLTGKSAQENLDVLNSAIQNRNVQKAMFMINNQPLPPNEYDMSTALLSVLHEGDRYTGIVNSFQYGIMQGKRMERAKRKRAV